MCCKVFRIPEIEKPAGEWCGHWRAGAGCSIHPIRPRVCRDFFCLWMIDPTLPDVWKPEHSRIVLMISPRERFLHAAVDPSSPQAWRKAPYFDYLRQMATRLEESDRRVIVFVGDNATLVTPRGATLLGRIRLDRPFGVEAAFGPDGPTYRLKKTETSAR
jgi:hypothetical protein